MEGGKREGERGNAEEGAGERDQKVDANNTTTNNKNNSQGDFHCVC